MNQGKPSCKRKETIAAKGGLPRPGNGAEKRRPPKNEVWKKRSARSDIDKKRKGIAYLRRHPQEPLLSEKKRVRSSRKGTEGAALKKKGNPEGISLKGADRTYQVKRRPTELPHRR